MHWELIVSLFGPAAALATLANAWLTNSMRLEIMSLRLEIEKQREKDREWIESKFATRGDLKSRFEVLTERTGIKLH